METFTDKEIAEIYDVSLLAREINWMETRFSNTRKNAVAYSLLAREINWMETPINHKKDQ